MSTILNPLRRTCHANTCGSRFKNKTVRGEPKLFCDTCKHKESVDTTCISCGSTINGWTFDRPQPVCNPCTEKESSSKAKTTCATETCEEIRPDSEEHNEEWQCANCTRQSGSKFPDEDKEVSWEAPDYDWNEHFELQKHVQD